MRLRRNIQQAPRPTSRARVGDPVRADARRSIAGRAALARPGRHRRSVSPSPMACQFAVLTRRPMPKSRASEASRPPACGCAWSTSPGRCRHGWAWSAPCDVVVEVADSAASCNEGSWRSQGEPTSARPRLAGDQRGGRRAPRRSGTGRRAPYEAEVPAIGVSAPGGWGSKSLTSESTRATPRPGNGATPSAAPSGV